MSSGMRNEHGVTGEGRLDVYSLLSKKTRNRRHPDPDEHLSRPDLGSQTPLPTKRNQDSQRNG